jgi:pyruvate ferredoxin oxidoreductase delta subunit
MSVYIVSFAGSTVLICPSSLVIKKMVSIDFDHCKGCGICVEVCPTNALLMFPEQQDEAAALANWPEPKNNEVKEN